VPTRRESARAREAAETSGRLERRAAVMAAFTAAGPGELLGTDQLAAATHYPPGLVRSIVTDLEVSGWLQPGRSPRGQVAWRRPTDNGSGTPPAAAGPSTARPRSSSATPPRAGDAYYCRRCRASVTSPEPPTGWYRIQQRDPAERYSSRVFQTLGLFCSTGCLAAATAAWHAASDTDGTGGRPSVEA
jgi:hypothetical protein